jgi:hypothetical protein
MHLAAGFRVIALKHNAPRELSLAVEFDEFQQWFGQAAEKQDPEAISGTGAGAAQQGFGSNPELLRSSTWLQQLNRAAVVGPVANQHSSPGLGAEAAEIT